MADIMVARVDFFYTGKDGAPHKVVKGTMFRSGHPVLADREELFAPADDFVTHNEHDEAHQDPSPVPPKKAAPPKLKLGGS